MVRDKREIKIPFDETVQNESGMSYHTAYFGPLNIWTLGQGSVVAPVDHRILPKPMHPSKIYTLSKPVRTPLTFNRSHVSGEEARESESGERNVPRQADR